MLELIPLLVSLLRLDPGILLLIGTLLGAVAVPFYILSRVFKLAALPPGTEGWNL